jgi:hypothetical protein
MNSYENPVEKSFSVEEDQATLKPSIQSTVSFKTIIDFTNTDLMFGVTN